LKEVIGGSADLVAFISHILHSKKQSEFERYEVTIHWLKYYIGTELLIENPTQNMPSIYLFWLEWGSTGGLSSTEIRLANDIYPWKKQTKNQHLHHFNRVISKKQPTKKSFLMGRQGRDGGELHAYGLRSGISHLKQKLI